MRSVFHVVDTSHPDLVVIKQTRVIDGYDLSGEVVFDRDNVGWVRQAIMTVAQQGPRQEVTLGNDSFFVYAGGHDMDPVVNLDNERGGEVRPGIYGRSFDREAVDQLLAELDGL